MRKVVGFIAYELSKWNTYTRYTIPPKQFHLIESLLAQLKIQLAKPTDCRHYPMQM